MNVTHLPHRNVPTKPLSPTGAYLDAVNAYPPVEPREEQELLKTIHAGRAAALLLERKPERLDHQRRLRDLVEHATAARKRLMEGLLALVAAIATEHSSTDEDLLETIQVGNHGLMRAIETFTIDDADQFTTFATASITAAITHR